MEMDTRGFGRITYERHELVSMQDLGTDPVEVSHWILLADKTHPHLFWLQSVTDAAWAIPACSLSGLDGSSALHIAKSQTPSDWASRQSMVVLAEILHQGDRLSLDLRRPFVIDAQAHRAIRLSVDDDQTLQRAPSEKVAPLRKCA